MKLFNLKGQQIVFWLSSCTFWMHWVQLTYAEMNWYNRLKHDCQRCNEISGRWSVSVCARAQQRIVGSTAEASCRQRTPLPFHPRGEEIEEGTAFWLCHCAVPTGQKIKSWPLNISHAHPVTQGDFSSAKTTFKLSKNLLKRAKRQWRKLAK